MAPYLHLLSGESDEFHLMLMKYTECWPDTKLVLVGFSMGANIVTKYLGELDRTRPRNIVGSISICQGYDAVKLVSLTFKVNVLSCSINCL